jgi:hypothetical protein
MERTLGARPRPHPPGLRQLFERDHLALATDEEFEHREAAGGEARRTVADAHGERPLVEPDMRRADLRGTS